MVIRNGSPRRSHRRDWSGSIPVLCFQDRRSPVLTREPSTGGWPYQLSWTVATHQLLFAAHLEERENHLPINHSSFHSSPCKAARHTAIAASTRSCESW